MEINQTTDNGIFGQILQERYKKDQASKPDREYHVVNGVLKRFVSDACEHSDPNRTQ